MTGTASEIKQKSERNRPRDHVAEGSHPGALLSPTQSHFISKTSCPLSPEFTSAALTGQEGFGHLQCYLEVAHRSAVNKERGGEYQNTKAEVDPQPAPVALLKTQKQRKDLIKSRPR